MTIVLDLPPEIEASLSAEAREKGVSIADIVRSQLIRSRPPLPAASDMSAEERERGLDELFDDVAAPAGIAEAAFHRENWYR